MEHSSFRETVALSQEYGKTLLNESSNEEDLVKAWSDLNKLWNDGFATDTELVENIYKKMGDSHTIGKEALERLKKLGCSIDETETDSTKDMKDHFGLNNS